MRFVDSVASVECAGVAAAKQEFCSGPNKSVSRNDVLELEAKIAESKTSGNREMQKRLKRESVFRVYFK